MTKGTVGVHPACIDDVRAAGPERPQATFLGMKSHRIGDKRIECRLNEPALEKYHMTEFPEASCPATNKPVAGSESVSSVGREGA